MTRILPLSDNAGDPAGGITGQAIIYSKTVGGVVKAYVIASNGDILELAGVAVYFNGADIGTPNVAMQYLNIFGADLIEDAGGGSADVRIVQSEHVDGDVTPTDLDIQASRHFVTHTGAAETTQEFNLPDGTSLLDGYIHTVVNCTTGGTRAVQINYTGTGGATDVTTQNNNAVVEFIWDSDAVAWRIVQNNNWT